MVVRSVGLALVAILPALAPAQSPTLEAERKRIARLESVYSSTKAALVARPNDAKSRQAHVDASSKLGTAVMNTPTLPPRTKYPRALRLFREALRLDPKNKEAAEGKAMIEGIYRSMGRPIPD